MTGVRLNSLNQGDRFMYKGRKYSVFMTLKDPMKRIKAGQVSVFDEETMSGHWLPGFEMVKRIIKVES